MNKTKIDLDNNLILKSENIEYNEDTLKNYLDLKSNFSSKEEIIGKWFGKTLYRKIITFNSTISPGQITIIPHEIENASNVWINNSNSFVIGSDGTAYNFPIIGYAGNITDKLYAYVNKTNVYIYSTGGWNTDWNKYITLYYTKTNS